jgi:glutathione S-transferase
LLPRDPRAHADVLRYMFFAATHIQPWMSTLGQERLVKPARGLTGNPVLIAHAEAELARFFPVLEQAVSGRAYLCESYSIADIFVGCGLEGAERRGVELSQYGALYAWRARLNARPAWAD